MTRRLNPDLDIVTCEEWPPHPDARPFYVAWSRRYGEDFAAGYDATEEYAIEDLAYELEEKGVPVAEIWILEEA